MNEESGPQGPLSRTPLWAMALGVVAVVAAVLVGIGVFGGDTLPERTGPPIEDLRVEKTVLSPGEIELTVRNAGPDDVTVAQIVVNDAYVDFTGAEEPLVRLDTETLTLKYPWVADSPYEIGMLTSTGVVIPHAIEAAVETPDGGGDFLLSMILIGLYVGRDPGDPRHARPAGASTGRATLDFRTDRVHGRPAWIPGGRRNPRST